VAYYTEPTAEDERLYPAEYGPEEDGPEPEWEVSIEVR